MVFPIIIIRRQRRPLQTINDRNIVRFEVPPVPITPKHLSTDCNCNPPVGNQIPFSWTFCPNKVNYNLSYPGCCYGTSCMVSLSFIDVR